MPDLSDILLSADFDRTITDCEGRIPEENIRAIEELRALGGSFTVNTGRSIPSFRPYMDKLPLSEPVICYNGAIIYDIQRDEILDRRPVQGGLEILKEVLRDFPGLNTEIQGEEAHYLYAENPLRESFLRKTGAQYRILKAEETPLPLLKFAFYGRYKDESVGQFFSGSPEEIQYFDRAEEELRRRYGKSCDVHRAMARIIDMQSREAGKGLAARRLARRLSKKTVVSIGDAMNDADMLSQADLAFVPSDCTPELKALGYTKTLPCSEGSIRGVLEELKKIF